MFFRSLFHFNKNRDIPVNGSGKMLTATAAAKTVSLKNWSPQTWKFLVDSKKCQILNVNPFHISIKHLLKINKEADTCDDRKELTYIRGNTLLLNQTRKPKSLSYCRLKPIYRKKDSYEFGKRSKPFYRFIDIKDEFIKVECYNFSGDVISENFHMHFIIKVKNDIETNNNSKQLSESNTTKNVNSKTNAQSTVLSNQNSRFGIKDRLNVLLVMIDSASRINSLRYLPKTRKYLTDTLEAVEMLGYNKVADNTMLNMVPFLTGDYYENQPCLDSKQGVDNCSFIWKNYAKDGYLTLY
ncbi:uncharacterized protein [Mytilus edulis]|uniref:uncharacterized protein n=1 Tax=Mytilus edulis TaxID=6550 RepID=UPI0039EE4B08